MLSPVRHFAGRTSEGVVNHLVPTFQKVSEDLLYSFLAVDIFGLWGARITNSLIRGRVPYDATQDPTFSPGMNEAQQLQKIWGGFWRGVNVPYFLEEAFREFLIGPGWLTAAAGLMGAIRASAGNSIRLPMRAIAGLGDTLLSHAPAHAPSAQAAMTPTATRAWLHAFTEGLLDDVHLKSTLAQVPGQPWQRWQQAYSDAVLAGQAWQQPRSKMQQLAESWQSWFRQRLRPAAAAASSATASNPAGSLGHYQASLTQLEAASARLKEAILHHNHRHLPWVHGQPAYDQVNHITLRLYQRLPGGWQQGKHTQKVSQFLQEMDTFRDVVGRMLWTHQRRPAQGLVAASNAVLRRLAWEKWGASLLTLGAMVLYTRRMTEYLQSHRTYPGNDHRRISELQTRVAGRQ